jgi:hypothetical protein
MNEHKTRVVISFSDVHAANDFILKVNQGEVPGATINKVDYPEPTYSESLKKKGYW